MKKIFFLTLFCLSLFGSAQPYLIGHTQITYTDPARAGRSIQTEIYYPAASAGTSVPVSTGTYPVIVFGHGFVMTWDAYQNVWEDLVPQGYIIAFPRTEGSISPNHAEFGKDLAFLVSKLESESATNTSSLFYNHINNKSAIMGHSMGGGSSFLAAENNTSITTMVTFAAANTTPPSITAAKNVTVPALVFSGQNDCVAPPIDHQIPMYDSIASLCKTFISIKGAAHCEFANSNLSCTFGESTCSPAPTITRTQQQDATSDFLKLWLEYYLKDNCNSWNIFNDSLTISPRITHNQQCSIINNPVITQLGSVLTSTPATTYQWFKNGVLISGAISQSYTTTSAGNYYVEVTYYNTCPYQSNTIAVLSTGLMNFITDVELSIYPNPATDQLIVDLINPKRNEAVNIRITNVLGQTVSQENIEISANQNKTVKYDISDLEKGVYFIEVKGTECKFVQKIIKQ